MIGLNSLLVKIKTFSPTFSISKHFETFYVEKNSAERVFILKPPYERILVLLSGTNDTSVSIKKTWVLFKKGFWQAPPFFLI